MPFVIPNFNEVTVQDPVNRLSLMRRTLARKESGVVTENDKLREEIEARKLKARKEGEYLLEEERIKSEPTPILGNLSPAQEFVAYSTPGMATIKFAGDASKAYQGLKNDIKYRQVAPAIGHALLIPASLVMGAASAIPIGGILQNAKNTAKGVISKKMALKEAKNAIAREIAEKSAAKTAAKNSTTITEPIKKGKTAFFYEPGTGAKVSTLPKGQKVHYTPEENTAFRNQINDFANKYGYEPIGEEVTDPEVLERYARSMIKRHNTFYRGVGMPGKKEDHPELWKLLEDALGTNFTKELALKYMATHAPGVGAEELYISPYKNVASMYGDPVEIMRPFKLGKDRTKWFTEGDFNIATAGRLRDILNFKNVKGIVDPWNTNEDVPIRFVTNELTGRNQLFIPQRITYIPRYGSKDWGITYGDIIGSKNRPTVPFTSNVQFKSGGKLNYIKFYK